MKLTITPLEVLALRQWLEGRGEEEKMALSIAWPIAGERKTDWDRMIQFYGFCEILRDQPQSRQVWVFVATVEQPLQAQANAKERHAPVDRLPDAGSPTFAKRRRCGEMANTWNHDGVGVTQHARIVGHVLAGVACETCHGDVAHMEAASQTAPLTMGWCLNCHKERRASTDCLVCHY